MDDEVFSQEEILSQKNFPVRDLNIFSFVPQEEFRRQNQNFWIPICARSNIYKMEFLVFGTKGIKLVIEGVDEIGSEEAISVLVYFISKLELMLNLQRCSHGPSLNVIAEKVNLLRQNIWGEVKSFEELFG